jgi:hypothetical protein
MSLVPSVVTVWLFSDYLRSLIAQSKSSIIFITIAPESWCFIRGAAVPPVLQCLTDHPLSGHTLPRLPLNASVSTKYYGNCLYQTFKKVRPSLHSTCTQTRWAKLGYVAAVAALLVTASTPSLAQLAANNIRTIHVRARPVIFPPHFTHQSSRQTQRPHPTL